MKTSVTKENNKVTIAIGGRIDSIGAKQLNELFDENLPGAKELVLDLGEATYISSSGLRVFLTAKKTMTQQGSMKVIHVQEDVMDIFDMTGFTALLNLEP